MPTDIKLKNSVTATNAPTSLQQGEVAINITDKKVWVGNAATTPVLLLGSGADGTFTNLTVSGVASFADGTVSAPSITNIGDTNTGIFFPAADTIAFTEGGVESMRIDSSGNVGINTTTITSKLTINTGTSAGIHIFRSDANANFDGIVFRNSANNANQSKIGWNGNDLRFESTGNTLFETNGSERMRLTSSGTVGIGTASPLSLLDVTGGDIAIKTSTQYRTLNFYEDTTRRAYLTYDSTGNFGALITEEAGSYLAFGTVGAERMRINSAGALLVGCTAAPSSTVKGMGYGDFAVMGNDTALVISGGTNTGGDYQIGFVNGNGLVGSVLTSGSGTAFLTTSDYRLKENIEPMTGALAKVKALKPVTYKWKVDGSDGQGFIAHELQEVVPDCVAGEKDQVNDDGSIKPQSIDTSFLVATLTAAIQEQQALITQLQLDVAALKGAA